MFVYMYSCCLMIKESLHDASQVFFILVSSIHYLFCSRLPACSFHLWRTLDRQQGSFRRTVAFSLQPCHVTQCFPDGWVPLLDRWSWISFICPTVYWWSPNSQDRFRPFSSLMNWWTSTSLFLKSSLILFAHATIRFHKGVVKIRL